MWQQSIRAEDGGPRRATIGRLSLVREGPALNDDDGGDGVKLKVR